MLVKFEGENNDPWPVDWIAISNRIMTKINAINRVLRFNMFKIYITYCSTDFFLPEVRKIADIMLSCDASERGISPTILPSFIT